MKISYIATAEIPSTRANSIQIMKVCQALTQIGESVHLYIPGCGDVDWNALFTQYGIEERFPITRLKSRPSLHRLDFTLKSLQLSRREKADVIYTRMLWVAWTARIFGIPVILEMHDLPSGRFGPLVYKQYLRSSHRKLTVYITKSLKDLTDGKNNLKSKPGEWTIAPDGVDLARYDDIPRPFEARHSLDLPEKLTAAYSGGFYPGRGLETLLDLAQSFPEIQFLWIGGTPEHVDYWKQKINTAGLNNVNLTGFVANERIPLYQAAADILLMPYEKRFSGSGGGNIASVTSPMKMFEYMAAGRAILSSDLPVLHEVLNDSNAVFYRPEDVEDLYQKFTCLITNQEKRESLSASARRDVQAYEWKTRMKNIMQVFEGK